MTTLFADSSGEAHERMPLLVVTVIGAIKGAKRSRAVLRGCPLKHRHEGNALPTQCNAVIGQYMPDDHEEAEARLTVAARGSWVGMAPLDVAVVVEVETWHDRPARLRRTKDRCSGVVPYVGKPDADNVAKLVLDAFSKAGVWSDDTRVSTLTVRRRYVPLDAAGLPIGVERTIVRVWEEA